MPSALQTSISLDPVCLPGFLTILVKPSTTTGPAPDPIRVSQPSYDLPYILTRGIVSVHEVEALFDM